VRSVVKWFLLRFVYNRGVDVGALSGRSHAVLNDGVHGFRLRTYYVDPLAQLDQLRDDFADVQVFSVAGETIPTERLASARDPWLHYLCTVR
jgi:hypothetical protein